MISLFYGSDKQVLSLNASSSLWVCYTMGAVNHKTPAVMFSLYFFSHNDEMNIGDVYKVIVNNEMSLDKIDAVHEGDFDSLDLAIDRMDNIGSRWIFYPNAYILKNNELIGIYFQCGLNIEREDFDKFQLASYQYGHSQL